MTAHASTALTRGGAVPLLQVCPSDRKQSTARLAEAIDRISFAGVPPQRDIEHVEQGRRTKPRDRNSGSSIRALPPLGPELETHGATPERAVKRGCVTEPVGPGTGTAVRCLRNARDQLSNFGHRRKCSGLPTARLHRVQPSG